MKNNFNPNILTRSSYTFFSSLLKINDIINHSIKNNFENVFLIDKDVMYGAMEFYLLAKKNNLNPIIGLEISKTGEKLFAKNIEGYKELIRISSIINTTNKDLNIDFTNLIKFEFDIPFNLYEIKGQENILKDFNLIGEKKIIDNNIHLLTFEEAKIRYGNLLDEIYFLFKDVKLIIDEKKNIIPKFKIENQNIKPIEYLKNILKENLVILLNNNKYLNQNLYVERLKYEFLIIEKMSFESYFLIVSDIVKWSKNNGIMVGPGRGSSPGSLISYLLSITTIDPIKHNLLFERFLNPDRINMPDIDIDFEDSRRDEVIEYITKKYGHENVAQIITFQTLKAKMSFKDIARIKGLSASRANEVTKLISEDLTLEESYVKNKKFKELIDSDILLKEIFDSAKLIEGLSRQNSTHAAGVVLSQNPITKNVPVQNGYSKTLLTQYSMNHMEYNGLLKIDILGLRNLSFIKKIIESIKFRLGKEIKLDEIEYDDSEIYIMLSQGKTSGIFQLDSPGMKKALIEIKPNKFEDVVATTSLFRPGPIKNIPEYAKRKNGLINFEYINDDFKKILEPTYGIIVYQEQIIILVQKIANFTLSKADILRRAIGKKDEKLLESLKNEFISGALKNGYKEELINEIYNLIFEFSNYGFNRSHAFAYTIISYQLSYLKIKYPLDFMCSLINSTIGNNDKTFSYINEIFEMGYKINKPSIFDSEGDFLIKNNEIIFGFRSIKKIGESIISKIEIVKSFKNEIKDLIDLLIYFEQNGITRNIVEILIKSGSLSIFKMSIEGMLNSLDNIYKYLEMIKIKDENLIKFDKKIFEKPNLIDDGDIFKNDLYFKEVVGFELPSEKTKIELKKITEKLNIKKEINLIQDSPILIVGKIVSKKIFTNKNGNTMAFVSIETINKKYSLTIWPKIFDIFKDKIINDKIILVEGKFDLKKGESIIVSKISEVYNE